VCELRVGADARGAHHETSAGVDGRARDGVPGSHLHGHALSGEHRGVDRGRTVDDDAVGGDLLAGPHDEQVIDVQLVDRHALLDARSEHGHVLGPELEQGSQRRARGALGLRLEVVTRSHEDDDRAGDFEIDVVRPATARDVEAERHRHARLAGVAEEQGPQRPSERGEGADGDERVHVGAAVAQVRPRRAVEHRSAPDDDGRCQHEREPLPTVELERRDHGHGQHGSRQHEHEQQSGPEGLDVRGVVVGATVLAVAAVVPGASRE
jgi:hypothetical protein